MRYIFFLLLGSAVLMGARTSAQTAAPSQKVRCENNQAQADRLSAQLRQTAVWDDIKLTTAQKSLAKLETSRLYLLKLEKRLNRTEQSEAVAESLDKNGEANVWRRVAADVRELIDTEKRKAKTLAADAGVSCSGCAYSTLISKVRAAIDAAVAGRTAVLQIQQQLATYKNDMAAAGC